MEFSANRIMNDSKVSVFDRYFTDQDGFTVGYDVLQVQRGATLGLEPLGLWVLN